MATKSWTSDSDHEEEMMMTAQASNYSVYSEEAMTGHPSCHSTWSLNDEDQVFGAFSFRSNLSDNFADSPKMGRRNSARSQGTFSVGNFSTGNRRRRCLVHSNILASLSQPRNVEYESYDRWSNIDGATASFNKTEVFKQHILAEMEAQADKIMSWDQNEFQYVKHLQAAPMNQGSVNLFKHFRTGAFVAVKHIPNRWMALSAAEFDEKEPDASEKPWLDLAISRFLYDSGVSFICKPLGVYREVNSTYVVTEYANGGDLLGYTQNSSSRLPSSEPRESWTRRVMYRVFSAVLYLHELGVAHGDISLENILLTTDSFGEEQVKLIDFGMAKFTRKSYGASGKKAYMAPEMHLEGYDSFLTDAFALGVCVFTLVAGGYPWLRSDGRCKLFQFVVTKGFREFVRRRKVPTPEGLIHLNEVFSEALVDLLDGLLNVIPEMRDHLGEACWSCAGKLNGPKSALESPWWSTRGVLQ